MIPPDICIPCERWMFEFLEEARSKGHISAIQYPILKMYLDEKLEEGIVKLPIP